MTSSQKVFYLISKAYMLIEFFDHSELKRTKTCLILALDGLKERLTIEQVNKVISQLEREFKEDTDYSLFDFYDLINEAIKIMRHGKQKYLIKYLTLAASNVREELLEDL